MTKWYFAKEVPDLYEWIVTEWYDGNENYNPLSAIM